MNYITGLLMTMTDPADAYSVDKMLTNLFGKMQVWGRVLVAIIGIAMIIVGVVKIAQGMMSGGRGQVNWVLSLGLILIGGILCVGGAWSFITSLGGGMRSTLNTLGTTTVPGASIPPADIIIQGLHGFFG